MIDTDRYHSHKKIPHSSVINLQNKQFGYYALIRTLKASYGPLYINEQFILPNCKQFEEILVSRLINFIGSRIYCSDPDICRPPSFVRVFPGPGAFFRTKGSYKAVLLFYHLYASLKSAIIN